MGYGPASPTMAVYQHKVQPSGLMVFSIHQNPKEVGLNAVKEWALQQEQAGKGQKLPSSVSLHRIPVEGKTRVRSGLRIWIKGLSFYDRDLD